jgi:site-specific DNA-methyltransferase (adenine-specific)
VQWTLPTAANYQWLRDLLNRTGGDYLRREYEDLRREYEDLRREYEDLRREYEDLRRPFSVTAEVPYTDVWTFPTVQTYRGKHPCEKPLAMMEHIVRTSSRPGAVVIDMFMGSGTTGVCCANLGRRFIGIELDPGYFRIACDRIRREWETYQGGPMFAPKADDPELFLGNDRSETKTARLTDRRKP